MKTAMERMLDAIEWTSVEGTWHEDGGDAPAIPVATHSGILEIAGHRLRVYQLSDGRRVVAAEDLERFFGELNP